MINKRIIQLLVLATVVVCLFLVVAGSPLEVNGGEPVTPTKTIAPSVTKTPTVIELESLTANAEQAPDLVLFLLILCVVAGLFLAFLAMLLWLSGN